MWRGELDFHYISEFNTPRSLSVMGNAAADICKPVLMEISRTVAQSERKREKHNARNKAKESVGGGQHGERENKSEIGLANVPEMDYNALKRESKGQTSKEDGYSAGKDFYKEKEGRDLTPCSLFYFEKYQRYRESSKKTLLIIPALSRIKFIYD